MDWNGNLRTTPFVPRPDNNSLSFFYNYNYDPYSVLEMKHPGMQTQIAGVEKNQQEKKKRLTTDQLESLENCFQEEIKLDPDRKMKLARELGLQPRQIAVWFQNRRARWKNKQLERLYDSLKQDFDLVSREKLRLQEEVLALRSILKEQVAKNPVSTGYTEISGEETVESTSIPTSSKAGRIQHMPADCTYVFNVDDYNNNNNNNNVMPPYWTGLPTYP